MTNKLKIVWHYPHLKLWMGGTKFIYEVAKRLVNKYEVTLLCNLGKSDVMGKFEAEGIRVKTYSPISSNSLVYWLLFPLFALFDLIQSAKTFKKADIIIATLFPSNLFAAIYSQMTGKPFYYYCYEPFPFLQNEDFIKLEPAPRKQMLFILRFLYRRLDTWATRKAAKVFTLNQVTQKMIKSTYGKDSIVTLMGVDIKHFKPKTNNKLKSKHQGEYLIAHSTDYTPMKRTDLAIEAFARVVEKEPTSRLLITSTQPDSPRKELYVEQAKRLGILSKVELMGLVDYDLLPAIYSEAVCYLSCSYDEMLGTTSSNLPVKEALACGTPAIRANITTEDVEDGISGFLVDPRDTNLVAQKIVYLINNPDIVKNMGQAGQKKIRSLYQWQKVASIIKESVEKNNDQAH